MNKNKIHTPKTKHNNQKPISQWGIAWINSYVPKKNITAQEQITKMVKTLSNRLYPHQL